MISNKVKWILGIFMVFSLILATNLIDRDNFRMVEKSIATIYEDRLVVSNLIIKITMLIQEKEIANSISDSNFYTQRNVVIDKEISKLIDEFWNTKLTRSEEETLNRLQKNLSSLQSLEKNMVEARDPSFKKEMTRIKESLVSLSEIQMKEGRRQVFESKMATDTVELFTQMEFYLLIVLGIFLLLAILHKPKDDTISTLGSN